jgi:hypothetical protein
VKKIDAALRAFDAAVRGTEMALRCAIIVMIDISTLSFVSTLHSRATRAPPTLPKPQRLQTPDEDRASPHTRNIAQKFY